MTVCVTDDDGDSDCESFLLTVNNTPPVVATPACTPANPFEGDSVSRSATYTDAGADDTHTCTVDSAEGDGPEAGTASGGTWT